MSTRRNFITTGVGALAGLSLGWFFGKNAKSKEEISGDEPVSSSDPQSTKPLIISTWNHGLAANEGAWNALQNGGRAVDAAEAGVRISEADPDITSVGYGGAPDRDGHVTLDACIMDENGKAGSVCALKDIKHPISVARKVMDETPHVILAGEGARLFAIQNGFEPEDLLTERAKRDWEKWKETSNYQPVINVENHDTIGLLVMDKDGNISGACTTSGLAYKMAGRVGDSPIIGAGLYVDNEVGGATATGLGETVLRACGSFLVVELMRQGLSPTEACKEAVHRIMKNEPSRDFQVGFIAINKKGEYGGYAVHPGFNYALKNQEQAEMIDTASYL